MKLRNALCALLVAASLSALAVSQQKEVALASAPSSARDLSPSSPSTPADLKILFTGYLLGYYRLPQWQTTDFQLTCPEDYEKDNADWRKELGLKPTDKPGLNTPAYQFLHLLLNWTDGEGRTETPPLRAPGELLLGVGDNFGVTLESRAYRSYRQDDPAKPWDLHAKSRNLANQANPDPNDPNKEDPVWTTAPADQIGDNVGCFLSRAGYDAIVPGKNDFYFGPERLQRIAQRLANVPEPKDPSPGSMHKVRLLAANLIVRTEPLDKPEHPVPDSDKLLKFLPGMPDGVESLDVSDGGTLLPYLRQVRFKIAPKSKYSATPDKPGTLHPFLCEISLDPTKSEGLDQLAPHYPTSGKKNPDTPGCKRLPPLSQGSPLPNTPLANSIQPEPPKTQIEKDGSTTMYFNLPEKLISNLPALFGLCVNRAPIDVTPLNKKLVNAPDPDHPQPEDFYCLRFTIARPLFWELSQGAGKNEQPKEELQTNYPYVVRKMPNGNHAVIFGVVDQDITSHVGRDNLSWRNELKGMKPNAAEMDEKKPGKETYGTIVAGVSPTTALVAAMRHFDLVGRKNIEDGKPIYRILLAQMDRGKAETLGATLAGTKFGCTDLHFDVIISAAADGSAATASEDVIFRANPKPEEKEKKTPDGKPVPPDPPADPCDIEAKAHTTPAPPSFRQFVVVPYRGYDNSGPTLLNPLRELVLDDQMPGRREFTVDYNKVSEDQTAKPKVFQTNEDKDAKLQDSYNAMGSSYLAGKGYWPTDLSKSKNASPAAAANASKNGNSVVVKNAFQIATLAILRESTKADVAMLQKHDFYFGPFPDPINQASDPAHPNGELLERILWMGDYLTVLTVKGSTLKKVLDESDKYDALDEAAAIEGMETERGVLTFGLQKTRDEQYLVDGMQLDPNRLYTIATSNHIASGDTGYPELADPAFTDPQLPAPDKDHDADDHNPRISTLVCQQLGGSSCVANPGLLFAEANGLDRPSQLKLDLAARAHAYSRNFIGSPRRLYDGNSLVDYQAQLEPTWRFSVKDLTVNFSAVRNNLSEVQRATQLSGVQEPGAGNPKAHSADVETHIELVRNKPRWDEFARGSFLFKVSTADQTATVPVTTNPTAPTTVTQPALRLFQFVKNQAATDAGFFWHRKHKYSNRIGLVLEPFHWDTQIERQPLLVNTLYGPDGETPSAPAIIKNLPHVYRFLGRIAFRAEGDKNYAELGYEAGRELNGLKSIGACDPTAAIPLTTCLQGLQSMQNFSLASLPIATQSRERNGIYANVDWTTPLFWKFSLHSQDFLEYYGPAHLDNSTDTKYRNDATETLAWQALPNLSIGPSLERFDYENKVNFVHFRTWTPGISVTYSFDVYRGGSWMKSLKYGPNASGAGK